MTVSSTHCLRSGPRRAAWAESWALRLVWLCVLLLALAAPLRAEPTDITALRVDRTPDAVLLTAQLRFPLPDAVESALLKGIPVFFVAEAQLLRDRWYWYDKEVATATRYMRLSYQPLTRRWRLLVSGAPLGNAGIALGQTFDSVGDAIAAVQRISGWKIAGAIDADADHRYYVTLRFRLDTSQLPRPLQIGLAGQPDWDITAARSMRLPVDAR